MVARAFDNSHGARIAHRKAFTCHATEIALAINCAIKNRIADNNAFFRNNAAMGRRINCQPSTGKTFTDIVIGLALKLERNATRQKRTKTLASRARQLYRYCVFGKPCMAVALGKRTRQHGARRTVNIRDRRVDFNRSFVFKRRHGFGDEFTVRISSIGCF